MPYFKEKYRATIDRVRREIKQHIYHPVAQLSFECWHTKEPVPYDERTSGTKLDINIGDKWGDLWDCAWFHFTGKVPAECKGKSVVLMVDLCGEGLVFDETGCPVRGLTSVESDFDASLGMPGKRILKVSRNATGSGEFDFWVDAGCNDLFGNYRGGGRVKQADIATCNEEVRNLFYDFSVLFDAMNSMSPTSARYNSILFRLYDVCNTLYTYSDEEIAKARAILKPELDKKGGDPSLKFTAIGHAHIDLAWLWPIRETVRKGARTFSTVLAMMDRYPDYRFGASQPQLYEWMKIYYPALYEKIKQKIKEGKWETQGAMWVEADTNIISGESLVRQMMYGRRFYKEEFDEDVDNLWLPDVFGYSAALPQILKKCGVNYFMTQKLSWSEHNKFPHQTFMWEGIDGTEIFTHMLPEETYNSPMAASMLVKGENNFLDAGMSDEALILFGIGDGGGGPGPEHLERAMRLKNLAGIPPVEQGFAKDFFKRIDHDTDKLRKWCGELYLEKHQGTYTTQAKNKFYNRRMELAMRELEFALILCGEKNYPKEELDSLWKEVLLYQFHDIIPGSSIKRVYDESLERYAFMYNRVLELTKACYAKVAGEADGYTAFNALPWDRSEIVDVDGKLYQVDVPSMGYAKVSQAASVNVKAEGNTIENDYLKVVFNEDGSVGSIFDKVNGRESLKAGTKANVYNLYEDIGDCWDIPIQYLDKAPIAFKLESQKTAVDGACAVCHQTYKSDASTIELTVKLASDKKYVEFDTKVDWHENQKMLRTSFTTDVYTQNASYEIQFGKIERSTHDNTTWDLAKFEVCGHKWVDLSQEDYGVAMLNDSKYGYRVVDSTLDIDLLRAQNYPGQEADRGEQHFRYAIYPHAGNECAGDVSKVAYAFNVPLSIVKGGVKEAGSLLQTEANVCYETVKRAEDSDDVVIRAYEPYGRSVKSSLTFDRPFKKAYLCNMMEEELEELPVEGNTVSLCFKPFEIHTIKLK